MNPSEYEGIWLRKSLERSAPMHKNALAVIEVSSFKCQPKNAQWNGGQPAR